MKKRQYPEHKIKIVEPWYTHSAEHIFDAMGTNADKGLSPAEAEKRLHEYGKNTLPRAKRLGTLKILIGNIWNPIAIILILAMVISFIIGHLVDAVVLGIVVVMNVGFAVIQEYKANQAIEKILSLVSYQARVIRGGRQRLVEASSLVPGDIIVLKPGMKVPADARLFNVQDLTLNESSLTGEFETIRKQTEPLDTTLTVGDQTNMVFLGTTVDVGIGRAVVVGTGTDTELGHIVSIAREIREPKTPLQQKLGKLGLWISVLLVVIGGITFSLFLAQGYTMIDAFIVVVALVASTIPEGLLPAITIILTVAMRRIFRAGSLVRRMAAVETLGNADVICLDKTGTITEGKMRAREIILQTGTYTVGDISPLPSEGIEFMRLLVTGISATIENSEDTAEDWRVKGNATERAMVLGAGVTGINATERAREVEVIKELPFDSSYKFAAVQYTESGNEQLVVRGAPEILLDRATYIQDESGTVPLTKKRRERINERINGAMAKGLRVVALCIRKGRGSSSHAVLHPDDVGDLTFLGAIVMHDPIRPETASLLLKTRMSGIRTIMVTGDHAATATAIAKELGLVDDPDDVIDGKLLSSMTSAALRKRLKTASVFARVTPAQKLRIVQSLQKSGNVVAVTGDGVNDAPAITAAEIGIALGSGTDVAKEAADIVLLDNNFKTIVKSVEEGRFAFENMRKAAFYMLSDDFSEVALIVGAILMGLPLPLTTPQILWVNVVESSLLNIGIALEPGEQEVLRDKPRGKNAPFFNRAYQYWIFATAVITGGIAVGLFPVLLKVTGDLAVTRTMMLALLAIQSIFLVHIVRHVRSSFFSSGVFGNKWLNIFSVLSGGILLIPIAIPALHGPFSTTFLSLEHWIIVLVAAVVGGLLVEAAKVLIVVRGHFRENHKTA